MTSFAPGARVSSFVISVGGLRLQVSDRDALTGIAAPPPLATLSSISGFVSPRSFSTCTTGAAASKLICGMVGRSS